MIEYNKFQSGKRCRGHHFKWVSEPRTTACPAPAAPNGWGAPGQGPKDQWNYMPVTNQLDWTKPEDDLRAKCKQRCEDDAQCKAVMFRFKSATSKDNLCQLYRYCPVDNLVTQGWAKDYELFTKTDIASTVSSLSDANTKEKCQEACMDANSCKVFHFNANQKSGDKCKLFSKCEVEDGKFWGGHFYVHPHTILIPYRG